MGKRNRIAAIGDPMTDQLPGPGTWTIHSVHSWVAFTVEHFTVAFARGIAAGPTGSITIADDLPASTVRASITCPP